MEAEAGRQSHHQGLQLTLPSPGIPGLDVVRALHQVCYIRRIKFTPANKLLLRSCVSSGRD